MLNSRAVQATEAVVQRPKQALSEADPLNAAPTAAFSFHLLPLDPAPGTGVLQARHAQHPGRAGSARYGHETRRAAHCSLSMSMSFSSKSLMRSWLAASNMNVTESPWSSACAKYSALSFQHGHVCFDLTYSRDAFFTSCRRCHLLVGTCYRGATLPCGCCSNHQAHGLLLNARAKRSGSLRLHAW